MADGALYTFFFDIQPVLQEEMMKKVQEEFNNLQKDIDTKSEQTSQENIKQVNKF